MCHGFAMCYCGTQSCHCNHFYHSCVSCGVLTAGKTTGSDCNHCAVLFAENVKIVVPITNLYKGKWEVEVGGLYVTAGPVTGKYYKFPPSSTSKRCGLCRPCRSLG